MSTGFVNKGKYKFILDENWLGLNESNKSFSALSASLSFSDGGIPFADFVS